MSLVPEWVWWLVVAMFAVGYVAVHEIPLAAVRDVLPRSRRRRTTRRLHLRRVGGRGRLPRAAERSGPLELDARGPVEYRLAIDEPSAPEQHVTEYVPRDVDPLIRTAIANGGLVVLEGPAASGKTRSAHAALSTLTGRRLVVPIGPRSLPELVRVNELPRHAVIWLDDLERFLTDDGLDLHTLERLCPPGRTDVTILATLRGTEREGLPADRVAPVLGRATVIAIPLGWSSEEFFRAEETDDPLLAAAMENRHGLQITEYVAAAPESYARWRGARDGRQAIAGALITAAVDARRCGYPGPVPRDLLAGLAVHYLGQHELLRWDSEHALDQALAWATDQVRGNAGCLLPSVGESGQECYEPFDHLVRRHANSFVDSTSGVPDRVWELLADRTPVSDVLAFVRDAQSDGRAAAAERVLACSLDSNPTDVDLMAALGSILCADTERQLEAEQWLAPAAEAGHPGAMVNLARLLAADPERADQAEHWYRQASGESRSRVGGDGESVATDTVATTDAVDDIDTGELAGLDPEAVPAPGSEPDPEPGWLDKAIAAERSSLTTWLGRVFPGNGGTVGERVSRTEQWLADRMRRKHLDVVDPEAIGPDWLPAPWLDRFSGRVLRIAAGLVESALAMALVVVALLALVGKASETIAMPAWQTATVWTVLLAAGAMGGIRAAIRAVGLIRGAPGPGRRFAIWNVRKAGWRWWAGELGWLVAGLYCWLAAYLVALLVEGTGGADGVGWTVTGLVVLVVTAPYALDRAVRSAARWWRPVTDRPEPYAQLYAGVRGAAVISTVSGLWTLLATGALGLLAVELIGTALVATVWPLLAVVAGLGSFLHNGGLVWLRHLATRVGAWRIGMSLGRRFFEEAVERGTVVRTRSGYAFADAAARRELARAYRVEHPLD